LQDEEPAVVVDAHGVGDLGHDLDALVAASQVVDGVSRAHGKRYLIPGVLLHCVPSLQRGSCRSRADGL
jgi:hypothetical protein